MIFDMVNLSNNLLSSQLVCWYQYVATQDRFNNCMIFQNYIDIILIKFIHCEFLLILQIYIYI